MKTNNAERFTSPPVFYESMRQVLDIYEIPSTTMLERMIRKGTTWTDGYTTFDWDLDEKRVMNNKVDRTTR